MLTVQLRAFTPACVGMFYSEALISSTFYLVPSNRENEEENNKNESQKRISQNVTNKKVSLNVSLKVSLKIPFFFTCSLYMSFIKLLDKKEARQTCLNNHERDHNQRLCSTESNIYAHKFWSLVTGHMRPKTK